MDLARVGLLVAATRKLEVCKLFVYLQIVWFVAEQFLILETDAKEWVLPFWVVIDLMANSFKVWQSIFGAIIMITASMLTRAFKAEDKFKSAEFSGDVLLAIVLLLVFHCFVTRLGFESIEKIMVMEQNEQLLNNKSEGIIIVEDGHPQPAFLNESAKDILQDLNNPNFSTLSAFDFFPCESKIFAKVDFDEQLELKIQVERAEACQDYKNIHKIIEEDKESGTPGCKHIFKIKRHETDFDSASKDVEESESE